MASEAADSALLGLPAEILVHVLSSLKGPDLARVSASCRRLRELVEAHDEQLWKEVALRDFPGMALSALSTPNTPNEGSSTPPAAEMRAAAASPVPWRVLYRKRLALELQSELQGLLKSNHLLQGRLGRQAAARSETVKLLGHREALYTRAAALLEEFKAREASDKAQSVAASGWHPSAVQRHLKRAAAPQGPLFGGGSPHSSSASPRRAPDIIDPGLSGARCTLKEVESQVASLKKEIETQSACLRFADKNLASLQQNAIDIGHAIRRCRARMTAAAGMENGAEPEARQARPPVGAGLAVFCEQPRSSPPPQLAGARKAAPVQPRPGPRPAPHRQLSPCRLPAAGRRGTLSWRTMPRGSGPLVHGSAIEQLGSPPALVEGAVLLARRSSRSLRRLPAWLVLGDGALAVYATPTTLKEPRRAVSLLGAGVAAQGETGVLLSPPSRAGVGRLRFSTATRDERDVWVQRIAARIARAEPRVVATVPRPSLALRALQGHAVLSWGARSRGPRPSFELDSAPSAPAWDGGGEPEPSPDALCFSPPRLCINAAWFVDGKDYFAAVHDALLASRREILLSDWWFTPELYLLRGPEGPVPSSQLLRILEKKAAEGVRVFLLVWNNSDALYKHHLSGRAAKALRRLHPRNVFVLRAPKIRYTRVLRFALHDKLVVTDQDTAFVSGIDLCLGRYDTPEHLVADPTGSTWAGKDYMHAEIGMPEGEELLVDGLDREALPRLPWHDWRARPAPLRLSPARPTRPLSEAWKPSAPQAWNGFCELRAARRRLPFVVSLPAEALPPSPRPQGTCIVQVLRTLPEWVAGAGARAERSIHEAYVRAIEGARHFVYIENQARFPPAPALLPHFAHPLRLSPQFFISSTGHRDHDPMDREALGNRVAAAIVERVCRAFDSGQPFRVYLVLLAPSSRPPPSSGLRGRPAPPPPPLARGLQARAGPRGGRQHRSLGRGEGSVVAAIRARRPAADVARYLSVCSLRTCGLVGGRHVSTKAALGPPRPALPSARRPAPPRSTSTPRSPAPPPPSGAAGAGAGAGAGRGLRGGAKQLMVVDDELALVGSANLNERSLAARHDSETCVAVGDAAKVPSLLGGRPFPAAKCPRSPPLPPPPRVTRRAAGPGPLPPELRDPASEAAFDAWNAAARRNTEAFRALFPDLLHCPAAPAAEGGHAHGPGCPSHLVQYPMRELEEHVLSSGPGVVRRFPPVLRTAVDALRRARRRVLLRLVAPFL
eukprot:tig00020938_g16137.t1